MGTQNVRVVFKVHLHTCVERGYTLGHSSGHISYFTAYLPTAFWDNWPAATDLTAKRHWSAVWNENASFVYLVFSHIPCISQIGKNFNYKKFYK